MTYSVDSVVCDYGVFEVYLDKKGKKHKDLKLICNRRDNALLIAEIMNKDNNGEYGRAGTEGAEHNNDGSIAVLKAMQESADAVRNSPQYDFSCVKELLDKEVDE